MLLANGFSGIVKNIVAQSVDAEGGGNSPSKLQAIKEEQEEEDDIYIIPMENY